MLRLLALMMICVLTLSHGSIGVAATHGPNSAIGHTHDPAVEIASADDHHDAHPAGVSDDAAGDSDDTTIDTDTDVAHVHPLADEVRSNDAIGIRVVLRDVRNPPVRDKVLTPVESAPLLEPPSA